MTQISTELSGACLWPIKASWFELAVWSELITKLTIHSIKALNNEHIFNNPHFCDPINNSVLILGSLNLYTRILPYQ
jgi:hypothetical protein